MYISCVHLPIYIYIIYYMHLYTRAYVGYTLNTNAKLSYEDARSIHYICNRNLMYITQTHYNIYRDLLDRRQHKDFSFTFQNAIQQESPREAEGYI